MKEKNNQIVSMFFKLASSFSGAYGVVNNINIFLDNNLIQDIKHQKVNEERGIRFKAIDYFFNYLLTLKDINFTLVITPVIFYESSGKKKIENEKEFFAHKRVLLEFFDKYDFPLFFLDLDSFKNYNNLIDKITEDEKSIIENIRKLEESDWKMKLKEKGKEKIIYSYAQLYIPEEINLKYFSEWYVKFFMTHYIEQCIINTSENNKDVRNRYRDGKKDFPLHVLMKDKKKYLEGLGDIELFSYCDLSRQYTEENEYLNAILTFDETLYKVFFKRQTLMNSFSFVKGKDDLEELDKKIKKFDKGNNLIQNVSYVQDVFVFNALYYLEERLNV